MRRAGGTDDVRRRAVLAGLSAIATGSALTGSAQGTSAGVRSIAGPELPTWSNTEHYEEVVTANGGTNRGAVLDHRFAAVTRSLSQANMKLWNGDDAARAWCTGGTVGHQHRFVATTKVQLFEKVPLSYYYDGFDNAEEIRAVADPVRIPTVRGLKEYDRIVTDVEAKGPAKDSCERVTFRINNVHDQRIPMSAFAPDDPLMYGGSYGQNEIVDQVRDYQRRRNPSPHMPDSENGLVSLAEGVTSDVKALSSQTKQGATGVKKFGALVGGMNLGKVSKFAGGVSANAGKLSGAAGRVSGWATVLGTAFQAKTFFEEMPGEIYAKGTSWTDDRVLVEAEGTTGAVAVQFVDFTVTVPPGTVTDENLTVSVKQEVTLDELADTAQNGFAEEEQDALPNDELLGTYEWEIEIPLYDAGDVDAVTETPTAYVVTDDEGSSDHSGAVVDGTRAFGAATIDRQTDKRARRPFEDAPVPEFGVRLSDDEIREDESVSFEVTDYEDDGDSMYRWRVFKQGGRIRPLVFYGRRGTMRSEYLSRTATGVQDPTAFAFGPGVYAVELTIRNEYGKTNRASDAFAVRPVDKAGTEIALDRLATDLDLSTGDDDDRTLSVDVSGTVGHDGTTESLDVVEWELGYPGVVSGGTVDTGHTVRGGGDRDGFVAGFGDDFEIRDVERNRPNEEPMTEFEHTFRYPGVYRLSIAAFSFPKDTSEISRPKQYFYELPYKDRSVRSDRRDLTVFVTDQ